MQHYRLPLNWSAPSLMLMVILRWEAVILGYSNFKTASGALVNAAERGRCPRFISLVENGAATVGQFVGLLIQSHCTISSGEKSLRLTRELVLAWLRVSSHWPIEPARGGLS